MTSSISVVIPAFNEEQSIHRIVSQIRSVLEEARINGEVIVIDDGSTDSTASKAASAGAGVVSHSENLGYGEALKTGIRIAGSDIIVIVDADETYPVEKIPDLLSVMDHADMVVGARTGSDVAIPPSRKPFKWIIRRLAQFITRKQIPRILNSGFRAFRKKLAFRYFHILPDGFSFTTTITVAAMCNGYRVEYIPIDYHQRKGTSKIVPRDFFSFLLLVMRLSVLFRPLRVFVPVSMFCFSVGIIKLIMDIILAADISSSTNIPLFQLPVVSPTALIFITSGLQIALIGMVAEALARHNIISIDGIPTGKDMRE